MVVHPAACAEYGDGMHQIDERDLLERAAAAAARAYAPYSKFRVGAALLAESGHVYAGCNVENASYGLSVCAERSAVFAAVAAEGPRLRVRTLALACDPPAPCPPCGACRQVLAEFGPGAAVIYPAGTGHRRTTVDLLLPARFDLELPGG